MDYCSINFPEGFPEHFREVIEFRFSLEPETDRGCAMMVASFLDHKLEQLLRARFVDDPTVASEYLSQSGPLGTFSSRINAAYLFGLIGKNIRRDMHLIRKIRNKFGHSHRPVKFTDDQIRNRCNELFHFSYVEPTDEPRKMFVKTTMSILAVLNADLRRTEHVDVGQDLHLSTDDREKHRDNIRELADTISSVTNEPQEALRIMMKVFENLGELADGQVTVQDAE